ncbi:MAG: hypothetical protein JSV71_06495 [Nitrospiraceae bacterium]|nr:MAG: hypothetical protein JSV71_06495 [Nitrospiraceae bacterium]
MGIRSLCETVLHALSVPAGVLVGALAGWPVAKFITSFLDEVVYMIINLIIIISGIFVDDEDWASSLFDFYDSLFKTEDSTHPLAFIILLVIYEIFYAYFCVRWLKKRKKAVETF